MLLVSMPLVCAGAVDETQEFIEVLRSNAPIFEKVRACQQLGEFGTAEAVPALAALLSHPQLSAYARTGLERIPGPEAGAALRRALDQMQGKLLIGVIHSLGALQDEEAVPALSALSRDADPEVATAALLALGRIANDEAVTLVRQVLHTGPKGFRPEAAAACLLAAQQQLDQGNTDIARDLYDAVRQAQVPASYRIGATRGAIMARRSDRIAFLMQQLRSNDPAMRDVALLTIREIPSDALASALTAELERAPRGLQLQLMTALKDCHNAQSLQAISAKVESSDPEVRLAALKVLKDIGASDSAATFLKALNDGRSKEEMSLAVSSLELMGGAEVDAAILKTLQAAPKSSTCVQLIRLLGLRHVTQAKGELLRQAGGPDTRISVAAYQALKSLAAIEDLPALIAMTKACRNNAVRDAAVGTIYSVCNQSEDIDRVGALLLQELKTSTVSAEKLSWIRVLALLGYAEALPAIAASLQDTNQDLVQGTISHLGRWPDPSPINDLFDVVEGDSSPNTRTRALLAVLQLSTNAADRNQAKDEELLAWFRRAKQAVQSVQEKRLLISGLGRVQHIQAVQLLASYLDDTDVKIEAAHAIVNAAGPLVKGPDYRGVETVLQRISGIQDQRLRNQIAELQRDIKSTHARLNQ